MTVGTKMHQTLSSIEGAKADLESFALETQDTMAKNEFNQYAMQLEDIAKGFRERVNFVEQQEPQYKVKEAAQQKAQQKTQQPPNMQ